MDLNGKTQINGAVHQVDTDPVVLEEDKKEDIKEEVLYPNQCCNFFHKKIMLYLYSHLIKYNIYLKI